MNNHISRVILKTSLSVFVLLITQGLVSAEPEHQEGRLVINEVMSSNDTALQDIDGDYPDWIELYNGSLETVNLEGYTISDSDHTWTFPPVEISPKGYLVVFASSKNRYGDALHTNFKIKSEGEKITLKNDSGKTIDRVKRKRIKTDHAYGRIPDGHDDWIIFGISTPGTENQL